MARKRELGFVWFFLRFIIQALVCPVLLVITLSQKTLETFLPFAVGATILILDLVVLVIRYRKQSKMAPGPEQAAAQPSKGSVLSSMSNIVAQLARVFLLVLGTSFWWSFFFAKEPVTERVHVAGTFLWYSDAPSLVKGCGISMILLLFVRGKPGSPWLAMFGVSNSCKLSGKLTLLASASQPIRAIGKFEQALEQTGESFRLLLSVSFSPYPLYLVPPGPTHYVLVMAGGCIQQQTQPASTQVFVDGISYGAILADSTGLGEIC